jgi:hypothetical protein
VVNSSSPAFMLLVIGGLMLGYILPSIIAIVRRVECLALVIIQNTLPVAWPAAMILACFMPAKDGW